MLCLVQSSECQSSTSVACCLLQVAGDRYDANQMKRGWRSGVTASSA